jgi:putative FmdB family regulatory protein
MEKIRKFSDPPLKKCEHCGGKLEQLLSSPAIQFKGSGWYVTDYAKKSGASSSSSSTEASSSSDKKEDKKEKASSSSTEPAKVSPSKD